jgi:hypothetical protein
MLTIIEKNRDAYWHGWRNKLIRYWFYCNRGLSLLNEFKYLIMGIFALYYTLKLNNPIWLIIMGIISLPSLMLIGFIQVHYIGKVVDFLNIQYSSHWGKYGFELQENILKELKEFNKRKE